MSASENPFPGPQPYRAEHQRFFCGREDLSARLVQSVLAHGVLTVYGPSGAGKSSVVQASVLPALVKDYDVRTVTIDGWPAGSSPPARLVDEMVRQLSLSRRPEGSDPMDLLARAVRLAEQRSEQPIVIHLDQIEQLLFPGRPASDLEGLVAAVAALAERPARGLRVVLGLREDYLGLMRARTRGRQRLLDRSHRVGPLTVDEMASAVCEAAGRGEPAQTWSTEEIARLLLDVRAPGQESSGEAEVQAVYAQIVCRALWADRDAAGAQATAPPPALDAERILQGYLETTLAALGAHQEAALVLLEDHLVTRNGMRNLRTQSELERELPGAEVGTILHSLEVAGVLRGHEHQGKDRYFEVGHDWLARKVFDRKGARLQKEAQLAELDRQREEAEKRLVDAKAAADALLEKEKNARARVLRWLLGGGVVLFALTALAVLAAVEARRASESARLASQNARLASVRELTEQGRPAWAAEMLLMLDAAQVPDWPDVALDVLNRNAPRATLLGHRQPVVAVAWSPDGTRVATASADFTARIFRAGGDGSPILLRGHEKAVLGVAWSPDGGRVLTWSGDGTARVWSPDGRGDPLVLDYGAALNDAQWSPDGKRVATGARDGVTRVWDLADPPTWVDLGAHVREVLSVAWSPDGHRIATSSNDLSAMLWDVDRPDDPAIVLGDPTLLTGGATLRADHTGHTGAVDRVRWSPDGRRVVTASRDGTARVWSADGRGPEVVLRGHTGWVVDARWSLDGQRVLTASHDKTARIFRADGAGDAVLLVGHTDAVTAAAWSPDGLHVATASMDTTARVWRSNGAGQPLVLWGHEDRLGDLRWSPDGQKLATASEDTTAKVWAGREWNAIASAPAPPVPKIHASDFHADGKRVLSALAGQRAAMLWSLDGSRSPVTIPFRATFDPNLVALSPDGRRVAMAADNGWVTVADADGTAGVVLPFVETSRRRLGYAVAWRPDGRRLLVATDLGVEIWDPDAPARVALIPEKGQAGFASWSPDGQRIALISNSGVVRIAPADGSGAPTEIGKHTGQGFVALWSPDGKRLLTAGVDKVARVWTLSGAPVSKPIELRHSSSILLGAWSPDGRRVITGSDSRVVSVWDLDSITSPAYEPTRLRHEDMLSAIAFAPGGASVLTVSQGVVRSWPSSYAEFTRALREINSDCMRPDVRRKYLNEAEDVARSSYQACEKAASRPPALLDP